MTGQESSSTSETASDHTRQFWVKSKLALGEQFLIKIFLPKNYLATDAARYPVLYLTDADAFWGAATDFPYLLHWNNPSIIVVGISYGSWEEGWGKMKRSRDLTLAPNEEGKVGAEYFLKFLREELLPLVESQYRVDAANRTLFGWSAGGIFALYALFNQTELFRNIIAAGVPSSAFSLEEAYARDHHDLPVKFYMGAGEYDPISYPRFQEFAARLAERGYADLQFKSEVLPKFKHEYGAAVAMLCRGLRWAFYPQPIYELMLDRINQEGLEQAIAAYDRLKSSEADRYDFAESELNDVGYFLLNSGRIEDAIQILQLNVDSYPESANAYDSLGEAYLAAGNKVLAIANYQKSLELNPENTAAKVILQQVAHLPE